MDDFILFGDGRRCLKDWGQRSKDKLAELRLEMHANKYRLMLTARGVVRGEMAAGPFDLCLIHL